MSQEAWRLSTTGLKCSDNSIIRYEMYNRIRTSVRGLDLSGKILSISNSQGMCKALGIPFGQVMEASYPAYNICNLALPDNSFDVVLSDQVLEHIEGSPERAIDEVYRVLRPGGIAIHTTCFLTPFHGNPRYGTDNGDYWRFTHHGLQLLHNKYSRVIAADGWGNPVMPLISALGLTQMKVPHASWHPLNKLARYDWQSYHFVVWVIAQK